MGALAGRRIVVPETREIEVLAGMLERHGAAVVRCPLVAIRDAADPAPIVATHPRDTRLTVVIDAFGGGAAARLHAVAVNGLAG